MNRVTNNLLSIATVATILDSGAVALRGESRSPTVAPPRLVNQIDTITTMNLAFSPTADLVGLLSSTKAAIIDPLTGQEIIAATMQVDGCGVIEEMGCTFSADGKLFAANVNNSLVVIDVLSKKILLNDEMAIGGGALCFSPDNRQLMLGSQRSVHILDLSSGVLVRSKVLRGNAVGIQMMPDDSTFAVAHFSGDIDIWACRTDSLVGALQRCQNYCTRLVRAGGFLLAGCGAAEVQLWDPVTREPLPAVRGYEQLGPDFSASGSTGVLLASLSGGAVALIELRTGRLLTSWQAHTGTGIFDTAISHDGHLLVTSGYDRTIKVWSF